MALLEEMPLSFVISTFYITKGGEMKEENLDLVNLKQGIGECGLLRMFQKDVEKIPVLTRDEELIIARRSRMGDESSRNKLIESNLRFVLKVVYQYWSPGLPLMDMISEGCQGLMRAAKTFDPDKGFRFLTYAGDAISHSVIAAIKNHKRYNHDSLDELIYEDGSETTQKGLLVSEDIGGEKAVVCDQVCSLLGILSERERTVVNLRFWQYLTLDEVGLRINLGKERVRQIETKALRKLRWAIDERTMIGHGSYTDTAK